ncbi:hypothetical protein [Mycobacterium phage WXIN]|nr:hypothetical protein [Mycobacterium phage WXIN]
MSDYRVHFRIEDLEDDLGNRFSVLVDDIGRQFLIRNYNYRYGLPNYTWAYGYSTDFALEFTVSPMPRPPAPKPRRKWSKDMGLRKPK